MGDTEYTSPSKTTEKQESQKFEFEPQPPDPQNIMLEWVKNNKSKLPFIVMVPSLLAIIGLVLGIHFGNSGTDPLTPSTDACPGGQWTEWSSGHCNENTCFVKEDRVCVVNSKPTKQEDREVPCFYGRCKVVPNTCTNPLDNIVGSIAEFERACVSDASNTIKFKPKWKENNAKLTYRQFVDALKNDDSFLADFIDVLKTGSDYDQYYFECPPVSSATQDNEFEFIISQSTTLDRNPTPNTFSSYFTPQCLSVQFTDLDGDSTLISPCPPSSNSEERNYVHLASFMKNGPVDKVKDVWKRAGAEMSNKLSQTTEKWWFSTSGDGVAWLHVRIDPRPKFYRYGPYKS